MKILMLDAGPRPGNTHRAACAAQSEIAVQCPGATFEKMRLADLGLPLCTGCSLCLREGPDRCPHREQMDDLRSAVERCDGLVLCFPTYNMQPPALLKNVIDHWCYLLHRPRFFDKKALVVCSAGGVGAGKASGYVAGFLRGIGFNRAHRLALRSLSWNDYRPEVDARKIGRVARAFARDLASGKLHAPAAGVLVPYNLFRGMAPRYAPGTRYPTQDGVYYLRPEVRGAAYAPGVPLPFYKKWLGQVFYALASLFAGRMEVTYRRGDGARDADRAMPE